MEKPIQNGLDPMIWILQNKIQATLFFHKHGVEALPIPISSSYHKK